MYDTDFRQQIIQEYYEDKEKKVTVEALALKHNIGRDTVYRFLREYNQDPNRKIDWNKTKKLKRIVIQDKYESKLIKGGYIDGDKLVSDFYKSLNNV